MRRLNKQLTKHVGLPLQDRVAGTDIIKTLKFLRKSDDWTLDQLREYQLKKLQKLIPYLIENNDHFRSKVGNKTYSDFTWDDFLQLPLLTKEQLRTQNTLTSTLDKRRNKKGKTGGTTGPPVEVHKNTASRSFAWAGYYRWYEWMGLHYSDRSITFWGDRTVLSKPLKQKLASSLKGMFTNNYTISSFKINEETARSILQDIQHKKPELIKGYLSALLTIADHMKKLGIKVHPTAISPTTETVLPPYRKYLEEVFGCDLFDQYGCTEVTGVAFECPQHEGLHVNMEHVIVEVIDDQGNPVFDKPGRILLTDLDNTHMPFVRYDVGDIGILSSKPCSCGRKSYLLKSIEGRQADTITLKDGSKVHGVFFTDILYEIDTTSEMKRVSRFQARQHQQKHLVFAMESVMPIDKDYLSKLDVALNKFFDSYEIVVEEHLPEDPSGKFRYIIST